MTRTAVLLLITGLWPGAASALGLGEIKLESGLNEPFEARVELLAPTREELDTLSVGLADTEAFQRAGIERPFILSKLRFELVEGQTGPDYIRIHTREAIREPFLNFLIEAGWSRGRLFREYTVLLDPPLYDPGARAVVSAPPPAPVSPRTPTAPAPTDYEPPAAETPAVSTPVVGGYDGGDYGPTVTGDTLWSIANAVRPGQNVTVQQMMLAMLRANPEAFIENNVNGLRRGEILRIPSEDEIRSLSPEAALAEVRSQYALWDDIRPTLAANATTRPSGAVPAGSSAAAGAAPEPESELRLVAPGADANEGDRGASASAAAETGQANENLALANERLEALSQENADLKDQLTESETIIEDLKRLIALKDDELAALQQQAAEAGPPAQPAPAPVEEAAAEMEAEPAAGDDMEAGAPMAGEQAPDDGAPEEAEAEPPAAPEPAAPESGSGGAPAGLVDQVLGFLTGNLVIIGGAIAAVVVVLIGLVVVRRRSSGDEGDVTDLEFPDFADATAEPAAASEDATDINLGDELDDALAAEPAPAPAPAPEPEPEPEPEPAAAPQSQAAAPAAAEEEPEDDPLAEVNVFLAYEHFDQAEDFVREAINREPDNLEFHAKLLEIFYAANDRKKYEEAAAVLNEKVGGEGPHWDMALAMWQEMSPNRALFEEGGPEEDEAPAAAAAGGGMLDLTAEDSGAAGTDEDMSLDFDLGNTADQGSDAGGDDDEAVLDLTAGSEAQPAPSGAAEDEEILDVTAAVGLDSLDEAADSESDEPEEDVLDLTGGSEDDVLDISQAAGEDPLDVTAQAELEDQGEDLLDVTATASTEDVEAEIEAAGGADEAPEGMDLDLGLDMDTAADDAEQAGADNVLEFDAGGEESPGEEAGLDLDITAGGTVGDDDADGGAELDLSADTDDSPGLELDMGDSDDGGGLELDTGDAGDGGLEFDTGDADAGDDGLEFDTGDADAGDGGLEFDTGDADADDGGLELDMGDADTDGGLEMETPDAGPASADDDSGLELDFSLEDDASEAPSDAGTGGDEMDIDMEGTVEVPKLELEGSGDDDDDDDEHTVFVPRSGEAQEQSATDEIATKLDLAKAYVELGDRESAKNVLDEVMADGNDQQKAQARELLNQMS